MKGPKVSVCLTAYNRAHAIGKSIESLLGQDFSDFELVITDDASPDATEEVCRKYEQLDPRVKYFRNQRNLGMPGNLNEGLKRCRADLVANLHDGDVFRADLLRKWKDALEANPDAAFVFNQLDVADHAGRFLAHHESDLPERLERGELPRFMLSSSQCFGSPVWGTVMGRRAIYESVGWFDERFTYYSDVWMWFRLGQAYPVMYVREPLITLTPHEPDRPYARLDWWHERVLMTMYEDAVDLVHAGSAVTIARERRRLRRIRDRRWVRALAHTLRRGHLDRMEAGLAICRAEDSLVLNVAGTVGVALARIARVAGWRGTTA